MPSIPDDPQQSVIEGARRLGVEGSTVFNHASTKGLNAVLTRNLPKIGFITTDGHRDMLDGGRAWRPFNAQMDPNWRRSFGDVSRPLVPRYLRRGVQERILASGEVLIPLNEADARAHLELLNTVTWKALPFVCSMPIPILLMNSSSRHWRRKSWGTFRSPFPPKPLPVPRNSAVP